MGTVLVIYTGGTIGMKPGTSGYKPAPGYLAQYLQSHPSFNRPDAKSSSIRAVRHTGEVELEQLTLPPSIYKEQVKYAILEYEHLVDSSSIEFKDWIKIAKTIERNYKLFDGFVILHGTDSMAYSSSMLSFLLENLGKTVIFTGSQIPISQLRNDAQENLLSSLILAGHFVIPEVCLFFHHELYRGNRVSKTNAIGFDAFTSPNCLSLASVGVAIQVHWSRIHRPTTNLAFSVAEVEEVDVASFYIFPGIKGDTIRALAAQASLRGIVLHTFGAGNIPENPDLQLALAETTARGIAVINITQCMVGTVLPLYAAGAILSSLGVVGGFDMTAECALTKLTFLLGSARYCHRVAELIARNLRGELTIPDQERVFEHEKVSKALRYRLADLFWAIHKNDSGLFAESLADDTINAYSPEGFTPIHLATKLGRTTMVKILIARGAFVFAKTRDESPGHTALFFAYQKAYKDIAKLLTDCGAHLTSIEEGSYPYLKTTWPA